MISSSVILRSIVFQEKTFEVGRVYRYFYESRSADFAFLVLSIKVVDSRNFTGYILQILTLYDNDPEPYIKHAPGCLTSFILSEHFIGQTKKFELIA